MLELYVLWAIGELPQADQDSLSKIAPKLQSMYGGGGEWHDAIAAAMHMPPEIPAAIRDMWARNLEIARANDVTLPPEKFAEMFVDENFLEEKYPGIVNDAEMHSLENLRGIPRHLNSELHLKQIRREWNRFYEENPTATRQQLLQKATEIDARYGSQFNPPIKPGR